MHLFISFCTFAASSLCLGKDGNVACPGAHEAPTLKMMKNNHMGFLDGCNIMIQKRPMNFTNIPESMMMMMMKMMMMMLGLRIINYHHPLVSH